MVHPPLEAPAGETESTAGSTALESQVPRDLTYLADAVRRIDEKTAEIEAAVDRLSHEEVVILARRGESGAGDVEAIVARTRQDQMRLQELRDAIDVEQAPLPELKARRVELMRRYETLKRIQFRDRLKQILAAIDAMEQELAALRASLQALDP